VATVGAGNFNGRPSVSYYGVRLILARCKQGISAMKAFKVEQKAAGEHPQTAMSVTFTAVPCPGPNCRRLPCQPDRICKGPESHAQDR
jgi:hypothetical protein